MSIINKEENVAMVMKESRILTFYISNSSSTSLDKQKKYCYIVAFKSQNLNK